MSTTAHNYVFKISDFMPGDTVVCVHQHREVRGFIVGQSAMIIEVMVDIRKGDFLKNYIIGQERPRWEHAQVLAPNFYHLRMAPTRVVLVEKTNKNLNMLINTCGLKK